MKSAFPCENEVSSKDIQRARRIALRTRSSAACAKCRETKTKCNDYRPCARCKRNGEACDPVNADELNHFGAPADSADVYRASSSPPQINRATSIQSAASAGAGIGEGKLSAHFTDSIEYSDTHHSKRLKADHMKDESSSKLTSEYHSVYGDKSSQRFHVQSRPVKAEQVPCTPLLSTRGEKGGLLLPCNEPYLNAAWPTFPAQPQQAFPLNDEFGGATPCSVYQPMMPTVSRPSQIIALQPALPAAWLSPYLPAVSAGPLLGLVSGNRPLPMLAGGGWPGAAGWPGAVGSGAATVAGSAAERSLPPLLPWLAAAAAAAGGADFLSQSPALPASPPAPAIGPGWLGSAAASALPVACLPGTGMLPGFWLPPPPPPPPR